MHKEVAHAIQQHGPNLIKPDLLGIEGHMKLKSIRKWRKH
jgi:hypothetical protein